MIFKNSVSGMSNFKWYPSASNLIEDTFHRDQISKKDSKTSNKTLIKPVLHKIGRRVVYQQLLVNTVSISMDYCEVVISLCEVVTLVYNKLMEVTAFATEQQAAEAILKLDLWIKNNILCEMSKYLSIVATPILTNEINQLISDCSQEEIRLSPSPTQSPSDSPMTVPQGQKGGRGVGLESFEIGPLNGADEKLMARTDSVADDLVVIENEEKAVEVGSDGAGSKIGVKEGNNNGTKEETAAETN